VMWSPGHTLAADPDGECWIAIGDCSDYLFRPEVFSSLNPNWVLPGGFWADFANNNSPEYVVHIDTSKAGKTGQAQTPACNLAAPWLHEDASITLSTPADADNSGGGPVVVPITWTLTACGNDDGFAIGRLYVTMNKTIASAETIPEEMYISNGLGAGGQAFWAAPVAQVEGATSYFYFISGDPQYRQYQNGELYQIKTGEPTTIYVTINFRCNLVSGTLVSLYVNQTGGTGTITTDTSAPVINIIS